jgi:hypothetical protein
MEGAVLMARNIKETSKMKISKMNWMHGWLS